MGKVGTEATLQAILTEVKNIATDTDILAWGETAEDWGGVKKLVDHGVAAQRLPIGTQIIDKWKKAADGTEYDAPWDVVHHHQNGDMELNWHYAYPDGVPFDEPEAIYYADENGLAAGQYYINIGTA